MGEMELMSYFKISLNRVISWYIPDTEEWQHVFHVNKALYVSKKTQQVRED